MSLSLITLWIFVALLTQGFSVPLKAETTSQLLHFLNHSTVESKRLHQLCYAMVDSTPGLPCNPAFLGFRRPDSVWIYAHGNNNLEYFQDIADIVNGPIKTEELLPLMNHNSNEHFQLAGSIGYSTDNWGFNLIPYKLILFTHIRNPALPRINLLAAREQEAQFQVGSFINSEWSWGLQARAVHRRVSYNDSYLSDHFTEDLDTIYEIQTQNAYYLEPSLLYAPESVDWNPVFSVMLTNMGDAEGKLEPYNFDPRGHLGLSIRDRIEGGELKLGMNSQWIRSNEEDRLYSGVGVSYEFHGVELFSSLTELEQQLGIGLNLQNFTSSISYAEQDWNGTYYVPTQEVWRWDIGLLF